MKRLLLCLSILFFTFTSLELGAATHIVTDNGNTGAGTLRQALADASNGDEILFSLPIGSETIQISEQLSVSANITIDGSNLLGSGKYVTIEQTASGDDCRVLIIFGNVTLENLVLTGGNNTSINFGGGCVYVVENVELNLDNVTVTGNDALKEGGGIYIGTGASVTINNSTISNNKVESNSSLYGGGIYANANSTLIIKNSLISNNSATTSNSLSESKGGGICFDGSELIIENSTIASNQISAPNTVSEVLGGGICISADDATVNIVNSTIYNNTADNGDYDAMGGGIYSESIISILNSILVENISDGVGQDVYINTLIFKIFYSWFDDYYVYGSQILAIEDSRSEYSSGDLTNDALDYHGGYNNTLEVSTAGTVSTKAGSGTYAYYNETDGYYYNDGSDYRKISDNSTFTPSDPDSDKIIRDQRGYYRCEDVWYGETPTNSTSHGITRGAYQYYGVVANDNSDVSWQSEDNEYYTSIQGAINDQGNGDGLRLASTAILGEDINLDKSLTITSDNYNAIVRVKDPGVSDSRVFNVTSTDAPRLWYFTIMGGDRTEDGGAINVSSNAKLELDNIKVIGSKATGKGGGALFANTSSTVTISNTQFSGNEANEGGAIYSTGFLDIDNSTFSFNESVGDGGGIFSYYDGIANITNSTFYKNSSGDNGGGFYNREQGTIKSSTFSENSATTNGGGICNNSDLTIKNTLLGNNEATNFGEDYYHGISASLTDYGYNIVENFYGYDEGTGDITGDQANLFGNGVPTHQLEFNKRESWVSYVPTPTLRIEDERDNAAGSRSPAIKAGVFDADVIYDQRGKLRDDPPTIGAYDIGLKPPVPQASNVTFSDVETDRFTVSWTRSTDEAANGCTAFIYERTTTEWPRPIAMEQYTPDTEFGQGEEVLDYDDNGTDWFCIYEGNDANPEVTVTGLTFGKTYTVFVSEHTGPGMIVYNTNDATDNPNDQYIPADEVWYCADYTEGDCDGHTWGVDAFDDLGDAQAGVKEGGVVHLACPETAEDVTLTKTVELGEDDFQMTGTLDVNGGCFLTNGSAHLVRTGSSPLEFPFCFNGYTFYVVVSWPSQQEKGKGTLNGDEPTIGVRMNPDDYYGQYKSVIGAQWHLEGPDGLGATVQFMIPKAYMPNQNSLEQYLLSDHERNPLWLEHDATVEIGTGEYEDYWVITVEDVDEF
jgi:predicted outer membrane repeat protein